MKLLVLVRHGQSTMNAARAGQRFFPDDLTRAPFEGVPDSEVPLASRGEWQASVTGSALAARFGAFDVVYHSGFKRTEGTLGIMLRQFDENIRSRILIRADSGIRERDPGCLYNMTLSELTSRFPWWSDYRRVAGPFFAVPPGGGESLHDVTVWRARHFYERICHEHPGGRVLVVTHGETLRCLRIVIESLELKIQDGPSPKNCGVTVYEYDPSEERLVLKEYNTVYY